jgi:hypothetical protein
MVPNHGLNKRTQRNYQRPREQRSLKQIPANPKNDQTKYPKHPVAASFKRPVGEGSMIH